MNREIPYVLEAKNLAKTYQQGSISLEVLKSANLKIAAGECVALIGKSGSGKSTFLHLAGLLDTPTQGIIKLNGRSCHDLSDQKRTLLRRRFIGFVYQHHHLLPEFSALENVMLPQIIAGIDAKKAKKRAADLLGIVGLSARRDHRPARLSGGERQRIAIARALANQPALLLADEPTGSLDPKTAEIVFEELIRLVKETGLSTVIATHNMELAQSMDRTVHLENGSFVPLIR